MVAVSLLGAVFLLGVTAVALGLIAWLLSGSPRPISPPVRASARHEPGGDASCSGHQAPTNAATLERPGP